MNDDDEDEKDARIDAAFAALDKELRGLADALGDLNSLFPATREFLKRCGATHVKELTPQQMAELKAYLEAERAALTDPKKPLN
jgi:hypothetical protein